MIEMFLLSLTLSAQIKVAVIDTGIDPAYPVTLCEKPKDFTGFQNTNDEYGHGTNVSNIIFQKTKNTETCQYVLKVFSKKTDNNYQASVKALEYVLSKDIQVLNYSVAGFMYGEEEKVLIQKLLNKGVTIFVAAGNNRINLDKKCETYPACYDKRINVVGSTDESGSKSAFTNYGKVITHWELGEGYSAGGVTMSGTSQATAVATSKFINQYFTRKPSSEEDAKNAVLIAGSKQFKIDQFVNSKLDSVKKYIPKQLEPYFKYLYIGIDSATKQKVELKYEF